MRVEVVVREAILMLEGMKEVQEKLSESDCFDFLLSNSILAEINIILEAVGASLRHHQRAAEDILLRVLEMAGHCGYALKQILP